jgi:DNA polymerase-3 subunit delta
MPELSLDRLLAQLAGGAGKAKPLHCVVLLGEDVYLRDQAHRHLLDAFVPLAVRDWAVSRISLADSGLDSVLQQAQSLPMLSPQQVIFAGDAQALESLEDKAGEKTLEALAAYLDDPAPFTTLVFEAPALDQRKKLAKLFLQKAVVVSVSFDISDERQRTALSAPLAMSMARDAGVEMDSEAAEQLADCLDGNLGRMRSEVEKLAAYAGDRGRITTADIAAVVVSGKKYSVWQLSEILASRERARAMTFLDSVLREGEDPTAVVGAMAWMYRKLIEAQELPAYTNKFQAAGKLKMRPDTAELAMRQSKAIPRERLLEGIIALAEADDRLKSGGKNPRAVMEFLISCLTAATAEWSAGARSRLARSS